MKGSLLSLMSVLMSLKGGRQHGDLFTFIGAQTFRKKERMEGLKEEENKRII